MSDEEPFALQVQQPPAPEPEPVVGRRVWTKDAAPSGMIVVNFSGGRSSAYMLRRLMQEHGGMLPDGWLVLFANTGKEREETLVFVHDIEQKWGVPIIWLEYRYYPERKGRAKGHEKNSYAVVDFETASRNGEPFEQLIRGHRFLPNQRYRFCTQELKVDTFSRYLVAEHGQKAGRAEVKPKDGNPGKPRTPNSWISLLGIRHDEPHRWSKRRGDPDIDMPLFDWKVTKAEVQRFWKGQNFDLGIPSWQGNCDACFLKGKTTLVETFRQEPSVADWWLGMEHLSLEWRSDRNIMDPRLGCFSMRQTVQELVEESQRPELIPVTNLDDEPAIDCFCGD